MATVPWKSFAIKAVCPGATRDGMSLPSTLFWREDGAGSLDHRETL